MHVMRAHASHPFKNPEMENIIGVCEPLAAAVRSIVPSFSNSIIPLLSPNSSWSLCDEISLIQDVAFSLKMHASELRSTRAQQRLNDYVVHNYADIISAGMQWVVFYILMSCLIVPKKNILGGTEFGAPESIEEDQNFIESLRAYVTFVLSKLIVVQYATEYFTRISTIISYSSTASKI